MENPIKSALISVFHKDGLDSIVESLHQHGIKMFATGGTFDFINAKGIPVTAVEDITGFPSILGGRVKTLHPAVFGGILARRDDTIHSTEMKNHGLPYIDLVVVDLYPFEDTVRTGGSEQEIIEKIDIGGISLIRAAAKNFKDVLIIPSREDYPLLQNILDHQSATTVLETRKKQAIRAFQVSSFYDGLIARWLETASLSSNTIYHDPALTEKQLRYGENPHQKASYLGDLNEVFEQLSGKELSYNNLLDIDAALAIIRDFEEPCIAVIKHNNACGIATDPNLVLAWEKALQADPVSAFGGIIVSNREISKTIAEEMHKLFFEVLIAPSFTAESLELLQSRKNRILLKSKLFQQPSSSYRSVLNGLLSQQPDMVTESEAQLKTVTKQEPSESEKRDLLFAAKVVKHSKSNAIVLVKNEQLLGSGVGQTSRVDALRQAIAKALHFGFDLKGAVMASDAFFPFPDCVEIASGAGISAILQPGGSVKDQDSIDKANELGCAMVMTGIRHFKH